MKTVLIALAFGASALCFASGASAADSTGYIAQCKANIASEQAPANISNEQRLAFCQCFVDQVGNDQATLDEGTAMAKKPMNDRMASFTSASDKFKAAIQACVQKMGLQPPPPKAN